MTVLVLDLDRFKEINDSLGHAVGDALLRQVGPRLGRELRADDLLARLGGDEFVVVGRDLDDAGALALAGRLRAQLQRPFRVGGMGLTIDASVGVALGPQHSGTAEELLQLADLAMYSAKAARSGVAVYDDERDGAGRHRLEAVEQLRRGIAEGELVLHYQPKLALATGEVEGVEALVALAAPDPRPALPGRVHRPGGVRGADEPADLRRGRHGAGAVPAVGRRRQPAHCLGEREPVQPGRRGRSRTRSPRCCAVTACRPPPSCSR